ncbi:hypothetical protein Val02_48550 [Virgisporangium aliadipatigenens]|uniref:TIGR04222 domain-containing membrane protein n=1 Tax=Virgisporangium aliadipatigenens TaxID=741659 RepID=A0A8J3YM08_9ACTN|nr:TIGR04222 domain-containing membrane protein [Virgisporangium aliadipatigenens]GIJ47969.1 hypothetical protein Val02_48550 [Virgisporangium aliadipatigenens]
MTGSIVAAEDWSIFDENSWLGVPGLLALAAAGLLGRLLLQLGRPRLRHPRLSAFAWAYLAGGAERVTRAALAGLRAQGGIAVLPGHILHASAPQPYAEPVEVAVLHALSVGVRPVLLSQDPAVIAAMIPHIEELRREHLLLSPRRRRAARIVSVVGGIGGVLVGTFVFFVGLAMIFIKVGERPFLARSVLTRGRRRYPLERGWAHRGPTVVRTTVALHGDAALLDGDVELAHALGVHHPPPPSNGRRGRDFDLDGGGDGGSDGGGGGCGGGGGD